MKVCNKFKFLLSIKCSEVKVLKQAPAYSSLLNVLVLCQFFYFLWFIKRLLINSSEILANADSFDIAELAIIIKTASFNFISGYVIFFSIFFCLCFIKVLSSFFIFYKSTASQSISCESLVEKLAVAQFP